MPKNASTQPTEVELQILRILWAEGHCTVRQIHDEMTQVKETLYASTVKMLVVMLDKGLVKRDDSVRPQIYRAAVTQEGTQKKMLKNLIKKAYDGSATSLVLQALSAAKPSKEELEEIQQLIEQFQDEDQA